MLLSLVLLVNAYEEKIGNRGGAAFKAFLCYFLILSASLFSLAIKGGATSSLNDSDLQMIPPTKQELTNPIWNSKLNMYPVCSTNYNGLHLIDLGMLADAAYFLENRSVLERELHANFDNTFLQDWTLHNVMVQNYLAFFEIHFPSINMTVFSLRGTCTGIDVLHDFHYWFGVGFLQLFTGFLFPVINYFPPHFIQKIMYWSSLPGFGREENYQFLVEHVEKTKESVCGQSLSDEAGQSCNLLVTGHSLGGGMAALVGSLAQVPAVSFSGPGLKYNRFRFGISNQETIEHHVTTIKPDYDVVPMVDFLLGNTQTVTCPYKSPIACHMIFVTLNSLQHYCGDPRKRDWTNAKAKMQQIYGPYNYK
jgi:hypothetical protein